MPKVYNIDSWRMYSRIDYCGPLTLAYTVKAQLGINSLAYLSKVSETNVKKVYNIDTLRMYIRIDYSGPQTLAKTV
jgi:hypothetical protein